MFRKSALEGDREGLEVWKTCARAKVSNRDKHHGFAIRGEAADNVRPGMPGQALGDSALRWDEVNINDGIIMGAEGDEFSVRRK